MNDEENEERLEEEAKNIIHEMKQINQKNQEFLKRKEDLIHQEKLLEEELEKIKVTPLLLWLSLTLAGLQLFHSFVFV